ncbi:MAG: ribbon-helix-helix domain-containing protein [Candidatus Saliniplasma sp.]
MAKKNRISVNLPPSIHEELKGLSKMTGNSINSYVREGVFLLLKKKGIKNGD